MSGNRVEQEGDLGSSAAGGERREHAPEPELALGQGLDAIASVVDDFAHDLRNALFAIVTFTELAREGLPPDAPARLDLDEVLRASDRAVGLIAGLVSLSRPQP